MTKAKKVKEEYKNTNGTWLDPIVPSFLMVMSAAMMFIETFVHTVKPMVQHNAYVNKGLQKVFHGYVHFMDLVCFITGNCETCISLDNKEIISNSIDTNSQRFTNVMNQLGDLMYEANKEEIDGGVVTPGGVPPKPPVPPTVIPSPEEAQKTQGRMGGEGGETGSWTDDSDIEADPPRGVPFGGLTGELPRDIEVDKELN